MAAGGGDDDVPHPPKYPPPLEPKPKHPRADTCAPEQLLADLYFLCAFRLKAFEILDDLNGLQW